MSRNRLFLLVICILGLFFIAELSACRASRKLGCPMNFGQATPVSQQVYKYN